MRGFDKKKEEKKEKNEKKVKKFKKGGPPAFFFIIYTCGIFKHKFLSREAQKKTILFEFLPLFTYFLCIKYRS